MAFNNLVDRLLVVCDPVSRSQLLPGIRENHRSQAHLFVVDRAEIAQQRESEMTKVFWTNSAELHLENQRRARRERNRG